MYSVRSRAWFREFVHTLGRVVTKPIHQRVCAVATRRNTQNWLKKFVYYQKRRRTYFLIEMGEKSSLFYFIYPANSNPHENSGILARFLCFLSIFKLVFCLQCHRRNSRNNYWPKKFVCYRKRRRTYFPIEIGEKDMKVSVFYLIHPANSNSCENSGILTRFPCFMYNF